MEELIVERVGSLARLRLNRPAAINALTHGMVRGMDAALTALEADPDVAAILLTGEGDRGLCAGGDIRSLYEAPRVTDGLSMAFWRDEYRLDARIARCAKPFVAVMDGLVMGGGIGISAHAAFRVVTERSKIALPECGIGFVPDVGATWLLPRAPGQLGAWMGLTGRILGASDAILLGFADHFLPAANLGLLVRALAGLPADAGRAGVASCLLGLAKPVGPASLAPHKALIDRCFRFDRVEEIIAALQAEPGEFAAATLADLQAKSPTALKLALRLNRLGRAALRLENALELEYAAARALVVGHDFYEGIRAAIIDKDRAPKWAPDRLAEVSDGWVDQALQVTADRVFPAQGGTT
ncbi:enoyl-CoA hydratase/isomerase family protein [Rhodobacter sp. Har01]|uniref:enoyl-CoA hydratase/isomerase family protein n=1 Tax=Rhodobacter sp. Har01 TaxID=2883999 RepID=UPI001D062288|nr:enoyl-CoA hydratase/isomerase family protein [Rhodobacter sp. Har01]MCB6176936.1 enoyl-CoA hydratase/isomerase family protein [Rhodobacter sp. Har01]